MAGKGTQIIQLPFKAGKRFKICIQDHQASLQLSLKDVYTAHQQTLTVKGKNIRITIPAGIENGQTIKLKGYGGPGANAGPAGDLYITFSIDDDPDFKRSGNDLYTTVVIDLYTAVLGGDAILIGTAYAKKLFLHYEIYKIHLLPPFLHLP